MITIRSETADDRDAIRAITEDAFAASEFGYHGEADLVDTLRADCSELLSLVACLGGDLVGHAMFTPVTILCSTQGETRGMGLAPMSVAPRLQKQGVGSAMVMHGVGRLFDAGCTFIAVLGHPAYYPRFGFQFAAKFGVTHGFSGVPQEVFFILESHHHTLPPIHGGRAYYQPAFGPQHGSSDRCG